MINLLTKLENKVILERLVIGLEEPVLVKGIGEVTAKIDSGNSGYNVIHGTDFVQQGDTLLFTTNDRNENNKQISAKIIDNIDVNMGGNNIERRPVVELDIKFANDEYKKIPFSVTDRSSNNHPILISKTFIENELNALIDVGAKNISQDNIEVDYPESINEGVWDTTKGLAKGVLNLPKNISNALNNAEERAKSFRETGQIFDGKDIVDNKTTNSPKEVEKSTTTKTDSTTTETDTKENKLKGLHENFTKKVAQCETLIKDDPPKIREALAKNTNYASTIQQINPDSDTIAKKGIQIDYSKIIPFPLFNCLCQKEHIGSKIYITGTDSLRENWKSINGKIKEYTEKKTQSQTPTTEESEETPVATQPTGNTQTLPEQQPTNPLSNNQQPEDITLTPEEEKALEIFTNLNQFIVWLIPIGVEIIEEQSDDNPVTKAVPIFPTYKEVHDIFLSYLNSRFDSIMAKAFSGNNINPTSMDSIVQELTTAFVNNNNKRINELQEKNNELNNQNKEFQNNINEIEKNNKEIKEIKESLNSKAALFCLAYTENNERKYFIYSSSSTIVIDKK